MPKERIASAVAVWKHTTSATGNPQNNADNPRTSRPSERRSWALGAGSGTCGEDGGSSVEDGTGWRSDGSGAEGEAKESSKLQTPNFREAPLVKLQSANINIQ